MSAQPGMRMVGARPEHVRDVSALAERVLLKGGADSLAPRRGFLVSNFSEEQYRAFVSRAEHFYVAVQQGSIVGFVIAYTDRRLEDLPRDEAAYRTKEHVTDFVVIKQVCVDPSHGGEGIGSALYEYVLRRCEGLPAIAALVDDPPNIASSNFHRKNGFERFFDFDHPDGRRRVVWRRQQVDRAVLTHQYEMALDMYKHEDLLNWQKLNNFLYVTVGLFAVIGLVSKPLLESAKKSNSGAVALAVIICCIGLVISLGFAITLTAGVHYLQHRKQAVRAIERSLLRFGGSHIVDIPITESRWLERSPTTRFLRGLPLIAASSWTACALAVLVL